VWRIALVTCSCGRVGFEPVDNVPCSHAQFSTPPASSFADDFTAALLAARWSTVNSCIDQVGGELVASPPSTGLYCHAWTVGRYHLQCNSVTVEVSEVTTSSLGAQTYLYVDTDETTGPEFDGPEVFVLLEGGEFGFTAAGIDYNTGTPYDPLLDRWWRVRETDGELFFETAPDGLAWATRVRVPTPTSLDDVSFALGAGTRQFVEQPGRGQFRCFNVPPPCP
jgi:hypothetical protein